MAQTSADKVIGKAKSHLGISSAVPRFYLEELKRHMNLCPGEDKFRVTLQPNTGFGSVLCLKENCHTVVPLNRRSRTRGGGKRDGFGSLSAYRTHLLTHVKEDTRVGAKYASSAVTAPPKTSEIQLLATSRPALAVASQNSLSAPPRAKPEPIESMIPRKRQSDIGLNAERYNNDLNEPSLPKKLKTEPDCFSSTAISTLRDISAAETRIQEIREPIRRQERSRKRLSSDDPFGRHTSKPVDDKIKLLAIESESLNLLHTLRSRLPQNKDMSNPQFEVLQDRKPNHDLREFPMQFHKLESKPSTTGMDVAQSWEGMKKHGFPSFISSSVAVDHKPATLGIQQSAPVASSSTSSPSFGGRIMQFMANGASHACNALSSGSKPLYPSLTEYRFESSEAEETDSEMEYTHGESSSGIYATRTAVVDRRSDILASTIADDSECDDSEKEADRLMPFVNSLGVYAPPPVYDEAHDDNGDYHGRGRDLFVGPQAAPDDIAKFLIEAGNAETFDGNESVEKALKYLGIHNLQEKLPGLEISLMAHQAMGVAWMLEKERSTLLGGCLADEMGLGKTVQMMATMLLNRSSDPQRKTTLIIAPLALLDQWKLEIDEKSSCGFSCLIYHGQSKTRKQSELLKHDVVLTTFNTMAMEWPDYENEMKKKAKAKKKKDAFIVDNSDDEDMKNAHYRNTKRKHQAGLLFQTEFYRVVADEGQQIRNRRTRMSRAISDLNARYRWVLTGTPIVNGLADVYGYIRFLRIRPWYDWAQFQSHIGILEKKRPVLAVARLQKVMTTFLLRRKKNSKLDGKNLIELPEKKVKLTKLEFSAEEREVYSMVEARSQAKFNRYLREGTVLKNYHQVLVLLLRLRQICSHPCLIQEDGVAFVHPSDSKVKPQFATEITRASRLVSPEFVEKMKAKFKQASLERMQAEKQSTNATIEEDECPICYDAMTDAVITPCAHIFCHDCIVATLNRAPPMDAEAAAGKADDRPCPVCRSAISPQHFFSRAAFEPSDKDLGCHVESDEDMAEDSDSASYTSFRHSKEKGKAVMVPRKSGRISRRIISSSNYESDGDSDDISDFIVESDEDEEEKDARRAMKARGATKKNPHIILDSDDELDTPEMKEVIFGVRKKDQVDQGKIQLMSRFLPSSKMKHMMDLLQKLSKTNPEEKTLIVSQWTGCLSLVSAYLTENDIPHVKYQGDMNRSKRDQAVKVFMSKEKARVMLMSLKCGGVGLNLTRANNVISLDLGWSQAVESQAYDRVHRLGQTRPVTVQRVVIADTVEDRILALQERKQALADGSLGEGSGQKIGKLSVKELANLFGLDARGRRLNT